MYLPIKLDKFKVRKCPLCYTYAHLFDGTDADVAVRALCVLVTTVGRYLRSLIFITLITDLRSVVTLPILLDTRPNSRLNFKL